MNTEPNRAKEVFLEAVEKHGADQWPAFLDEACAGRPDLRRRVEVLLEAHREAGTAPHQGGAEGPAPAPFDVSDSGGPGTVIGPYKLLQQIGEGGMGAVFMAEQTRPVQRKVALKVIKAGMDSRQVVARFEAERQALALMDHPNIAKVLDAGATEAGRPYFVMELVKGAPLTKYCDEHKLTPRQRLELFVPVCQAVQHAHTKGVIHRDLKPTNVLVALYDGRPAPKVIDFGVAKAAGPKLTERTLFTAFGSVVGTLEYMSPEQAELNQLDVDTRSDIYSLGVLLYELLTGTTPLERRRLKGTGLVEALRLIREEEAPRPSVRVSTTAELPAVAASRGLEPRKLSGALRGELDWIVMKALEKDRNRRYETANGLAQDVGRFLADEAVQACPPSGWYRFRKFARRNRGRLAASAVLGAALVAAVGTAAGSIGWVTRDREARQARLTGQVALILEDVDGLEREQKWPEALAAADRAEAALAGGEADDAVRRRVAEARRDLSFVARLDRIRQERAATIEGKFNNAGAARDYATAFHEYGADVESLPSDEAVAQLRAKPALAAPVAAALDDWVEARRALGEDAPRWKALVAVACAIDLDPFRDRLRAVWGQRGTPELGTELRQLAESIDVKAQSPANLHALAYTLIRDGLPDSAVRVLRDGQYAYPDDFWLNLQIGNQLWLGRKDNAGALRYFCAAVSLRPDSAAAHNNLGGNLRNLEKLDEAEAECRKAVELAPREPYGLCNLGVALEKQGKVDEAFASFKRAVALAPNDARVHDGLGVFLAGYKQDYDGAIAEFRKAVELDPKFALAHYNLGVTLGVQGKRDEAVAEYRKAVELDPKYADAHNNLGAAALREQGKLEEAVAELRRAIELDPGHAAAHNNLCAALNEQGKVDAAVAEGRRAIELEPKEAKAHNNLGNALRLQGKMDEAVAEYRKAVELDPRGADAHNNLGNALRLQGKMDEAVENLRNAIELAPKLAAAHSNLGLALDEQGKLDEAVAEYRKAITLEPDYAEARCDLGQALEQEGEFHQALEELRRGHELGSKRPGWTYPSAEWLRWCERLIELDGKLPGFLDGKATPASADERVELAGLCALKGLNAAAARFYEDAFAAAPKLADDLGAAHRYDAACAAALAGCGRGQDANKLDDQGRARLRRQALDWLWADLKTWRGLLEKGPYVNRPAVAQQLRHWQVDADLAGVRGAEALAKLPEAERQPWHKLWDDAADLLARAQAKAAPKKTDAE